VTPGGSNIAVLTYEWGAPNAFFLAHLLTQQRLRTVVSNQGRKEEKQIPVPQILDVYIRRTISVLLLLSYFVTGGQTGLWYRVWVYPNNYLPND
jgi:hypothetical protein